ncbi:hypothetical protein OG339_48685 (plasmid) [Streptosporangium sp. NBC_01495]|uniref:hypothetical protein n=1 Tax=Streptosporangium sp. NBC_01495 TaxID=2903899 RepID=UPI002E33E7FB|nr:hypothetical protein [Streptosporangium sp. NBC_01495]
MAEFIRVDPSDTARPGRTEIVAQMVEEGLTAKPVFTAEGGREAVIVSVELYRALAELFPALPQKAGTEPKWQLRFIGRQATVEAVIIGLDLYRELADLVDDIQSAPALRERLAATGTTGGPVHTTVDQLAADVGVKLGVSSGNGNSVSGW